MKLTALITAGLLILQGCATPRFDDGTRASFIADRCDPRGACNVGKRP